MHQCSHLQCLPVLPIHLTIVGGHRLLPFPARCPQTVSHLDRGIIVRAASELLFCEASAVEETSPVSSLAEPVTSQGKHMS